MPDGQAQGTEEMPRVDFRRSEQKAEQEKLTPDRILVLASRDQGFSVSWRYRDEWLARRCVKLRNEGKLRYRRGKGETTYYAVTRPDGKT